MSFYEKEVADTPQLSLISPAKINLFFYVIGKREDGFHEIASLYQAINLHDVLTFSLASEDLFTCSDPGLAVDQTNLVIKALMIFRKQTGIKTPVRIHLEKKIPMQAGLGGGSSNAATTLWGLAALFSLSFSQQEFQEMGALLGSDVAFFFSSGTAYCTGRGEILEDIRSSNPSKQLSDLWIVKPKEGLSTPAVYKAWDPSSRTVRNPRELLSLLLQGGDAFFNDLEKPAFSLMPSLRTMKEQLLKQGFRSVTMSGSGTSFFCLGSPNYSFSPEFSLYKVAPLQKLMSRWYEI